MSNNSDSNIVKHWETYPRLPGEVSDRMQEYPVLVRQILFNRGITNIATAKSYFHALPPDETSPFLLTGMQAAVDRILSALDGKESIVVYGDYDVDGVTATALLVEALQSLGGYVSPYIPDRFEEGYGINKEAIQKLVEQGCKLMISVDCGIRSIDEAEYCRQIGLDLIITDHHSPLDVIPDAMAAIDPKLPTDNYPYRDLAGVGVAYKLAQALFTSTKRMHEMGDHWVDLVAIGTIADLAPLTGENRFLVRKGLEMIQKEPRPGILQLCRAAGIDHRKINSTNIGFGIGPRLNAAGRMETAMAAYHLLTSLDLQEAGSLARKLDAQNRARQDSTREMVDRALKIALEGNRDNEIIFAIDPDFSEGIVGLAASRLAEHFYRPAIVGRQDAETTRCSCRSIPEFHITQALDECKDLMEHHGGHAAAAGLTIRNEHLGELIERIEQIAKRELGSKELVPVLMADAEVHLSDLGQELYQYLIRFHPLGYSNPEPQFITRELYIENPREIGQDGKHLKFQVTDGWLTINAIAFNKGGMKNVLVEKKKADLLYTFETNEWNGKVDFQLNVKDIKVEDKDTQPPNSKRFNETKTLIPDHQDILNELNNKENEEIMISNNIKAIKLELEQVRQAIKDNLEQIRLLRLKIDKKNSPREIHKLAQEGVDPDKQFLKIQENIDFNKKEIKKNNKKVDLLELNLEELKNKELLCKQNIVELMQEIEKIDKLEKMD